MTDAQIYILTKSISIWQSVCTCWVCHKATKVYAVESHEGDYQIFPKKLPDEIITAILPISKWFFLDRSNLAEEIYYMNHCEHCGAKQGDWFLHTTSEGPFSESYDIGVVSKTEEVKTKTKVIQPNQESLWRKWGQGQKEKRDT